MEEKDKVIEQSQNENIEVVEIVDVAQKDESGKIRTAGESPAVSQTEKKSKKKKNEEDSSQYEGLSDDELYAKIQTEKLLKRKQTKKIMTLTGMCFAFVLAVCLIILAAVPVSLKPRCMENGFASVALYPGTTTQGASYNEGDEGYNLFMKHYDKAFGQSYISAIFSGSLFSYNIEEKCEKVSNVIGSSGELITNNTYFVRLRYSQEQIFTYQNGKPYKSNYSTSKWNGQNLTFTEVYFVVNQKSGFQSTEVYVIATYPKFKDGVQDGTEQYLITITVKANTFEIFDNWKDLTK